MNKSRHKPNSNVLLGSGCGMLLLDSCSFPLVWLTMNAVDMFHDGWHCKNVFVADGNVPILIWRNMIHL